MAPKPPKTRKPPEPEQARGIVSTAWLKDDARLLKERDGAPYDGLLGQPPQDLVSAPLRYEFTWRRNVLLDTYCAQQHRRQLDAVRDAVDALQSINAQTIAYRRPLIPPGASEHVAFLAKIWHAHKLGVERGRAFLGLAPQNLQEIRRDVARHASQYPRTNPLQEVINSIVKKDPKISEKMLLRELEKLKGKRVIDDIDNTKIHFRARSGAERAAPITGLKDRLSRAKRAERNGNSR